MMDITSTYTKNTEQVVYKTSLHMNFINHSCFIIFIEMFLKLVWPYKDFWLFSLHQWIFRCWSIYPVLIAKKSAILIIVLQNQILEKIKYTVGYNIHINISRKNLRGLPNMVTWILKIFPGVNFIVKLRLPCGNLTWMMFFSFHTHSIRCTWYICTIFWKKYCHPFFFVTVN